MAREWKSREEYKKEKELEEARKAGTVAPEQDEEGRDINPHIPQYIRNAPWYLKARPDQGPSLRHQRLGAHKQSVVVSSLDTRIGKGEFLGPAATKYRKGACENCGAMTHTKKDCTARPRKIGAKYKPIDIQPDERIIPEVPLSYDGKRDRWNGYDPEDYRAVMEQYEEMDQERRRRKLQEQAKKFQTESDPTQKRNPQSSGDNKDEQKDHKPTDDKDDEDEEGDDFKDSEKDTFSKRDPRTRTTIRNLRIREDTAKYLRNLDPNSAFYDPKSRSMRENPYLNTPLDPTKGGQSDVTYFGDNFVRVSGDVGKFYEIQRFAWEAYESGKDVHLQAVPSATEQIFHEHKQQKEVQQKKLKETLLQQYGGREYLEIPKELDLAQTEHYVEYTPDGQILQGNEEVVVRSKYPEDVYINNHTSVWGSYWENGKWGYKCCKQLVKNSYCTGAAGRQAKELADAQLKAKLLGVDTSVKKTDTPATTSTTSTTPAASTSSNPTTTTSLETGKEVSAPNTIENGTATSLRKSNQSQKSNKSHSNTENANSESDNDRQSGSSSSESESESESGSSSHDSGSESDSKHSKKSSKSKKHKKHKKHKHKKKHKKHRDEKKKEKENAKEEDNKKRKYNAYTGNVEVTEEELEEYRKKRIRFDDPMLLFENVKDDSKDTTVPS